MIELTFYGMFKIEEITTIKKKTKFVHFQFFDHNNENNDFEDLNFFKLIL